jgi:ATP-binding cassette subfamily C protein
MTQSPLTLLSFFISAYPMRFAGILLALLVAGTIEIIGIGALLPLLNMFIEKESAPSTLSVVISRFFDFFNIEQSFFNLLMIIVITITAKALIVWQAMKLVAYAAADITQDMRLDLIGALIKARWEYFSSLPIGHSANAIATEAEHAGQYFLLIGKTIATLIQAVFYIIIALMVDWKISLSAIVIGITAAFLFKFLIKAARQAGGHITQSLKDLLARLNESLSGVKPLKSMGQEQHFLDLLENDVDSLTIAKKKQASSNLLLHTFHEPLLVIFIAAGLYWAYQYAAYPFTELLLIAFLFNRIISQTNLVQSHYQNAVNRESAVHSLLAAINQAEENAEIMTGTGTPDFKQAIKLDNLTLSYGDNVIVENLNETIQFGQITTIFGPSGIGKSTLLDAILGLISPTKGAVLIDGKDLAEIDIQKWRHQIGYVPQDTFLFHDTIFKNVTLGDKDISREDVIAALKKARAWDFIAAIDDGLDHVVGERGGKLSGGQKQRIALARALVRQPHLLILDEATTGLDKESEDAIFEALQQMLPDITIIMISHDLKILDIADNIIKLEKED